MHTTTTLNRATRGRTELRKMQGILWKHRNPPSRSTTKPNFQTSTDESVNTEQQ